ncbi:MAG: hypothetical protein K2Y24_07255, partial [Pseudomonadaceae bacterium]|nr:hypothetical protein [Pseudomonadaceae bacterium]
MVGLSGQNQGLITYVPYRKESWRSRHDDIKITVLSTQDRERQQIRDLPTYPIGKRETIKMFKKSICALMAAISLAGCAAPSKYTLEDMQDPATTPVEKWSDATIYMHAMGITGMRDIPKSIAIEEGFIKGSYTGASANAIDVGVVGLSAVSPPSG